MSRRRYPSEYEEEEEDYIPDEQFPGNHSFTGHGHYGYYSDEDDHDEALIRRMMKLRLQKEGERRGHRRLPPPSPPPSHRHRRHPSPPPPRSSYRERLAATDTGAGYGERLKEMVKKEGVMVKGFYDPKGHRGGLYLSTFRCRKCGKMRDFCPGH